MASLRWIVVAALVLMAATAEEDDQTHQKIRQTHTENKQTCGKIVRTAQDKMARYLQGDYPADHGTACFVRCVAILGRWYDDETGINLDSFYEVYGKGSMTLEEYREQAKGCLEHRPTDRPGYCWQAYRPVVCLKEQFRKRQETTKSGLELRR